jgi:hypothetical protein
VLWRKDLKPFAVGIALALATSLLATGVASAHRTDPIDLAHELDHLIEDTNALRRDLGKPEFRFDVAYVDGASDDALIALLQEWQARFDRALKNSFWWDLALCESGGNWSMRGQYHGGFSFHPRTWRDYRPDGLPKRAYLATPAEQIRVARLVLVDQGWEAWPACSKRLGLR